MKKLAVAREAKFYLALLVFPLPGADQLMLVVGEFCRAVSTLGKPHAVLLLGDSHRSKERLPFTQKVIGAAVTNEVFFVKCQVG